MLQYHRTSQENKNKNTNPVHVLTVIHVYTHTQIHVYKSCNSSKRIFTKNSTIDVGCTGDLKEKKRKKISGLVRESNPGPLAPKARIMPLDQPASVVLTLFNPVFVINTDACVLFCVASSQTQHQCTPLAYECNITSLQKDNTVVVLKILVHMHK